MQPRCQMRDSGNEVARCGDANNHIAIHHQLTNDNNDWDSAHICLTRSTNYYQRLTLESWYTDLDQKPLN